MEALATLSAGEWLDVGFAAVVVWNMLWGMIRGFVRELINLIALVAAFIVASTFYRAAHTASGINFGLETDWMAQGVWYLVLIFGVWGLVQIINALVHKYAVDQDSIQFKNRMCGVLFGAIKGSFFVGLTACFMAGINTSQVPLGGKLESFCESSKVINFLQDHPKVVDQFRKMVIVQGASDKIIDVAAHGMVEYLGVEDPQVKAKAVELLTPLLQNPEVLQQLSGSPTAVEARKKFESNKAVSRFLSESPEVQRTKQKEQVSASDLKEILRSNRAKVLLQDPEVRKLILELDMKKISGELRGNSKKE